MYGYPQNQLPIEEITGFDIWPELFALGAQGGDRMSLIVDQAIACPRRGLYGPADWIDQWAPHAREDAGTLLAQASRTGTGRAILSTIEAGTPSEAGMPGEAGDARRFWDVSLSAIRGGEALLCTARDATEQVTRDENLHRIAYHDGLTGLLNRLALRARLASEMEFALASGRPVALMMLDLDNFKLINDTLGHDAGDAVLVKAANRLRAVAPDETAVGRLGGDEFALVVPCAEADTDLAALAEKVIDAMRRPIWYKGRLLDSRASMGMAIFPEHGTNSAELLKSADIALYAAKSFGRDGFTTYVRSMGNSLRKRAITVQSVREAIAARRVEVSYQPKIDLRTHDVLGFEALMRVRAEDGRLIPARALSHAFEDIQLAGSIGATMFERVASDIAPWRAADYAFGRIALNASAAEFRSGSFAPQFLGLIRDAGLSPELFEIEISETILGGRSTDYMAAAITELADAGMRVVLDEFGTGASSLAQLKRLPFHSLKIDRTFVGTLEDDKNAQTIVRAIAGLADGLGLGLAAVGIETHKQLAMLCELGCSIGQGNLLGKPASARQITAAFVQSRPMSDAKPKKVA